MQRDWGTCLPRGWLDVHGGGSVPEGRVKRLTQPKERDHPGKEGG